MMNGVGIEGYSETDIRCQRLKKAINQDCFKVITTRDDIDTLKITILSIRTQRLHMLVIQHYGFRSVTI